MSEFFPYKNLTFAAFKDEDLWGDYLATNPSIPDMVGLVEFCEAEELHIKMRSCCLYETEETSRRRQEWYLLCYERLNELYEIIDEQAVLPVDKDAETTDAAVLMTKLS